MNTRTKVKFCQSLLSAALLLSGTAVMPAASEAPRRIHNSLEDGQTVEIKGHVRPAIAVAHDAGPVDGSQVLPHMTMHFALSAAQQGDLAQFLHDVQDPNSKTYHKFLTPEQYATRFGMNSADLAKVQLWLEQQGFTVTETARGKSYISFSGTAAQVEAAFATPLHHYVVNGETHFANAANPRLPKALNGVVMGISGLNDFRPKPHLTMSPRYSSGAGVHYLAPDDWATIYDAQAIYKAGFDGTGVKIVVVGQSDVNLSDISAFRAAAGLSTATAPAPSVIHAGADPGTINGDQAESDLDLEWAGGVAKNATLIFVVGNPDVNAAIQYAVDNNAGDVLTTSYGVCETSLSNSELSTLNGLFARANTQGMTVVAASGNSGAAGCDTSYPATHGLAVDFPASSPYVTAVGGTTLEDSASNWSGTNNSNGGSVNGYIPEGGWNTTSSANGLAASGGGMSVLFAKPTWQINTFADGRRDVPDVAAAADPTHDAMLICTSDTTVSPGGVCTSGFTNASSALTTLGGTSAASPAVAGMIALLVHKTGGRQGNINSQLYTLASSTPNAFHDITAGSNIVPCGAGPTGCPGTEGYSGAAGYDYVTGLGTIDANLLVGAWADFGLSFNPNTLTIVPGNSGTTTITVTSLNGYTGTVSFTCSVASTLVDVSCVAPTAVSIDPTVTPSSTGTLTINTSTSAHVVGPWRMKPPAGPWRLWLLVAALLALAASFFALKQRRMHVFMGAAACFLLLAMASCGGSSSTTTTGTVENGNVTVTASSGVFVKSISVAVNIN